MELLEYYLLVNIYIIFFWIFFHFILRNEPAFQHLRIYLLASTTVSLILPFLHINSPSFSFIYNQIPRDTGFIEFTMKQSELLLINPGVQTKIDYALILKYLILAGSVMFFILNLIRHLRIQSLINKSESIRYRGLSISITSKPILPLLYNNHIIIPNTISKDEMDIIVEHEYQHFKYGHFIDNYFLQIVQIVFWINPSVYLLIRDLKQIHEYQVDREVINSGVDASIYKLTLVKYCVGFQKFAIANGLSDYKIKNRIIMINNLKTKEWKLKFLLFIPAFVVVFFVLSFTTSDKHSPFQNIEQHVDNKTIELTPISIEEIRALNENSDRDFIIVMINRNSQLLLNSQVKCSFDEINEKVNNSFQLKASDLYRQLDYSILSNTSPKIKFIVQRSTQTNLNDYDKLLDYLSKSIYSLQEIYSNKIFDKSYSLLDSMDQDVLNVLIKPRIYTLPDKNQ